MLTAIRELCGEEVGLETHPFIEFVQLLLDSPRLPSTLKIIYVYNFMLQVFFNRSIEKRQDQCVGIILETK